MCIRDRSRIAPSGPLAQIVLYTAVPDLLCGKAREFSDAQLKLIDKKFGDLPVFGQFYGKSSDFNLEAVLAAETEVIIDIGEKKETIKAVSYTHLDVYKRQEGITSKRYLSISCVTIN